MRLGGHRAVVVVHLGERLERRPVAGDELAVDVRRGARDVGHGDLAVRRALRQDLALDDLEVVRRDLELLGGDVEDPLLRLLGREAHGVAADERAARGERPGADRGGVGVGVVHRDPVVRDAEGVGDDLRVDGLRALADVDRAGEDVDATVRLELDPGLARVAVLVHARRVLDRREPATAMLGHQAPPPFAPRYVMRCSPSGACWFARCSGSRSPVRRSDVIAR